MPTIVTISNPLSGSVMDVPHSNFAAHQHLQAHTRNKPRTLNQTWTIVGSSDDVSIPAGLVNIYSGEESQNHLCIDIPHSQLIPGTPVQLYPADKPGGALNQQWRLV